MSNLATLDDILERHDREKFAFQALTEPEKARHQIWMRENYAKNPWSFLTDCVFTLDPVNLERPFKPFPGYLEYLHFLTVLFQKKRLLAIPKSRRMICSWSFISLFTHDTIFHPGRFNGFVSKKEDDAGELVSRSEFIIKHIPDWRIPKALVPKIAGDKMSNNPPVLEFPDINSQIMGFPQGADQMRQFTLSGILGDECAFWAQAQKFYSASKPTLDGGGRMVLISSRSQGFFKKIVFDQLDSEDLDFPEVAPVPVQKPMEGIEIWTNPQNKFTVVDLHYTANPEKRGQAWREAVKASMPKRDFEMEYEKSWQTFEGKPAYSDFNQSVQCAMPIPKVEPGLPLLLGVNFGLTPSIVLAQLQGRRLCVFKEFIERNGTLSKLASTVWNYLYQNFLNWFRVEQNIHVFVHPSSFEASGSDQHTCAEVLRICGDLDHPERRIGFKNILPGPHDWESRRNAVDYYLTKTYGDGPGLHIYADQCPVLVAGFAGGYRYSEKVSENQPATSLPIRNQYFPPQEALQFIAAGTRLVSKKVAMNIEPPSYGFQKNET